MGEPAHEAHADAKATLRPVINAPTEDRRLTVATEKINPSTSDKPIAWLVGVHGGCGVSTLATMLAPFKDAGGVIPAADDPNIVILVAETHRSGLRKLHEAVLQFSSGDAGSAELLGVVLVDRAPGKLPKTLAADVKRITEATPSHNVWRVPYVAQWREAKDTELPLWKPQLDASGSAGKVTRKQRKEQADPLRYVPTTVADAAADMFDRSLSLYRRINSQ